MWVIFSRSYSLRRLYYRLPTIHELNRLCKSITFLRSYFASDLNQIAPHFDNTLQISFVNPGNVNPLPDGLVYLIWEKLCHCNINNSLIIVLLDLTILYYYCPFGPDNTVILLSFWT